MRKFLNYIQSGKVGRYADKIVLGIFVFLFVRLYSLTQISANATDGVKDTGKSANSIRMTSIDYILEYDDTISKKTQDNLKNYFYGLLTEKKIIEMVNMRQHIYLSKNYTKIEVKDNAVYCPLNTSTDDLLTAIDKLE